MRLKTAYVRFYRSFNYDYLRKNHPKAKPQAWEAHEPQWYPYIRIPLEPGVTTVVGANESGKSHLLSAIRKGITGQEIEREDFCRYSHFFTVERGQLRWPDFGFEWHELSDDDRHLLSTVCHVTEREFDCFLAFRNESNNLTIYLPDGQEFTRHLLSDSDARTLTDALPRVFGIDPKIAMPGSINIHALARNTEAPAPWRSESMGRRQRMELFEALDAIRPEWLQDAQSLANAAPKAAPALARLTDILGVADGSKSQDDAGFALARDLLFKVAKIDPEVFRELERALRDDKEGYVNGIIRKINGRLDDSLNFPHWWVQDKDFRLHVSARESDLVFTIQDRTETEYSFFERSSGLKYFLSYYIQYLAHDSSGDRDEILLMDEPDAYLSSQAQQDLLKILSDFADPQAPDRKPVQVIYVTHSPFLIDKNHAERIRVLEKGFGDEGTRVVKDAAKNHYEPLRSAFGSFLGETTFIGNCNLMVEGLADQILLAGGATHLRRYTGASALETLDLNHLTIVPAGSASHVPYMVFLARGRDIDRPPIIVLLDSDKPGNEAKAALLREELRKKLLLSEHLILQIGDLRREDGSGILPGREVIESEDLVPLTICVAAAKKYARELCQLHEDAVEKIDEALVSTALERETSVFKALESCFRALRDDQPHLDKVGFARKIIDTVNEMAACPSLSEAEGRALAEFRDNMRLLFSRLVEMQHRAEVESTGDQIAKRINRLKKSFFRDHPETARREHALVLLRDIEASLDTSPESDETRLQVQRVRRDFSLTKELTEPVADFAQFRNAIDLIQYTGRLFTQADDTGSATGAAGEGGVSEGASTQPKGRRRPTREAAQPIVEG